MGWVWSDELAVTLRTSSEYSALIPSDWSSQPTAFALGGGETPLDAARRLLGLKKVASEQRIDLAQCACLQQADASPSHP